MAKRFLSKIFLIMVVLICIFAMQVNATDEPYTSTHLTEFDDFYLFKTSFCNFDEVDKDYTVIFAVYGQKELVHIELREHSTGYECFVTDNLERGLYSAKVMVLENTDNIKPITTVERVYMGAYENITPKQIAGVVDKTDYYQLCYYKSNAYGEYSYNSYPQYLNFEKDFVKLFYNGVEVPWDLFERLTDSYYGKMENNLSVIYISDYKTMVVDSVNVDRNKILSKNDESVTYADEGYIKSTLFDVDGKEIAWEDLKEWDVVSYTTVGNENDVEEIVGYVINKNVTGTVTAMMGDDVYIDGVQYTINDKYLDVSEFCLGDYGTFYIDIMGNIVWYQLVDVEEDKCGYVSEAKVIIDFDETLELRMFTADGCVDTYTLADTVRYNGTTCRYGSLATEDMAAELTDVFIYYELDEDNRIAVIKTPTTWTSVSKTTDFTVYGTEVDESTFAEATGSLVASSGRVYTTKATKIFKLGENESDFRVLTNAELSDGDVLNKTTFYNANENLEVEYVLVKGGITSSVEEALTPVVGVSGSAEELTFYQGGEEQTLTVNNYYFNKEIPDFGSVYIPVLSVGGEVKTVKELAVIKDGMVDMGADAKSADENYYLDKITAVEGDAIALETEGDVVIPETANVYFVDNEVKSGTMSDFIFDTEKDYTLFAREIDGEITIAVIYVGYTKYAVPEVITTDYGYVRLARVLADFEEYLALRIFSGDGSVESYTLAENVVLDGVMVDSSTLATAEYEELFTDSMIYFTRNEKNEILSIETPKQFGTEVEEAVYSSSSNNFTTNVYNATVTEDTKILLVGATESDFAIFDNSKLYDGDIFKNATFYDVENAEAGAILVRGGYIPSSESPLLVAVSTGKYMDDEGYEALWLKAFGACGGETYYADADYMFTPPSLGCVYVPVLSEENKLQDIKELTVVDHQNYSVSLGADAYDEENVTYYFGEIDRVYDHNTMYLKLEDDVCEICIPSEANIITVDGCYDFGQRVKRGGNLIYIWDTVDWRFWDSDGNVPGNVVFFGREVDGVITDAVFYINYFINDSEF